MIGLTTVYVFAKQKNEKRDILFSAADQCTVKVC